MNKTLDEARQLFSEIAAGLNNLHLKNTTVIVAPSHPYLNEAVTTLKQKVKIAAQNCSEYDNGAYTGEVSASMLKSLAVTHVIIGHSERRNFFNETNQLIKQKIIQALKNNLCPIFCIGENLEQRNSNIHFDVVKLQLTDVLNGFSKSEIENIVIAYEPVWAIGTGVTASSEQAQEMHQFIRKQLALLTDENTSSEISILYGGSCNEKNARELFLCPDVDGGLIGGASLKANSFLSIINTSISLQ